MARGPAAVLTVCALALAGVLAAVGDGATAAASPQELVVRFERGANVEAALASVGATSMGRSSIGGFVRAGLDQGVSPAAAAAALERRADVAFAEPNRVYELFATPNDPGWPLWGLSAIGAPAAWDVTQGSTGVVVAVVDSGTDYTHPDLGGNIWANPAETVNGADDDGDGLVDDVTGWDFYDGDGTPLDSVGHGTHVAGTIGAKGDNAVGVVGVNWRVKIMPLRVGDEELSGLAIYEAFRYACAKGAKVVNGSFGGSAFDSLVHQAIEECPGTLFVFAAGNSSSNNDSSAVYPCNDPAPNVVCVAASDASDALASFSNYGRTSVDLAAPGVGILSTVPGGYATYYGTSMAAPHVAGAAALVLAHRPGLSSSELRRALLLSVDPRAGLSAAVATGGRLNVAQALTQEVTPPIGLTATSPSHGAGWSNNSTVQIVWSGAADASGIGGYSFAFSPVADFVPDEVKDAEAGQTMLTMPLPDGEHWFHIRAGDREGNWGATVHVGPLRIDTFAPVRPVVSSPSHRVGAASQDRTIAVAWSGASDSLSGVDGYALSWSQGHAAAPPTVKTVEETVTRATSRQLADGVWWFNLRARDNAGNWSDAVSLGPFTVRAGPTACAVPRLRGLTLVAARRLLAKRGCSLGRITRARSRRVPRGRVLAQRPAPGIRLARGARVRVVLSRGRR